jgi:PAS domain S-box-containing protein
MDGAPALHVADRDGAPAAGQEPLATPADGLRLRRVLVALAILATVFLVVWRWPFADPFAGATRYAPFHTALETASIVVAMLVFGVTWNAYLGERPGNIVLLACALLATGIVDFVHLLSFAGMPDFITPSGPGKAINFWLAARFIVAATLLTVALRPWRPLTRPGMRWLLLGGYLGLAAVVLWVGLYRQDTLPRTFIAGSGLTAFKIGAEYGIIAILALSAVIFLRRSREPVPYDATSLCAAATISVMSEFSFTLYTDVADIFNLLGHLYKVAAYVFIYRAVFVASVREPFERLARAEAEMRGAATERARLAAAIEQAPALVLIADADDRIIYVNAAFESITGYRRAEVLGLDARGLGPAADDDPAYREATEALAAGGTWTGVLTRRRVDGSPIAEEAVISSTRDDQGDGTGYVMVARDVTHERALEAQLLQAQKMEAVGQLAGGIAHDFNNLLTAVRGYAELLWQDLPDGDPGRADLDEVLRGADRATELTHQLLAFARRQVLRPSVLDVAVAVEGIVPLLRRLLGEHITLDTYSQPDLGHVKADPSQLDQVIVNLAVNARDAMPEGGRLTIETANVELDAEYAAARAEVTPGPYVALSVSDTGVGMDPETQARAFEPFFTTKETGQGSGMGLATVYGIVKQSGGSIGLYSEPGRGTTFKVYLPRVAAAATARAQVPTMDPPPTGSETILLVEDDATVRAFARRALEAQGYTVLEAASGAEALSLAASRGGSLDLLVTDVIMPGLQGHQLAEQLRAARPDLPILYVSGFTENSVISHGVPGPEVAFLPKPYTAHDLARAVRDAMDRSRVDERLGSPV